MSVHEMFDDELSRAERDLADLQAQQRAIDERTALAARAGDEDALVSLSRRRDELPAHIHAARVKVARARIDERRPRVAAARDEFKRVDREATRLLTAYPDEVRHLGERHAALTAEAQAAQAARDSYLATMEQEQRALRRAERELEELLTALYGPHRAA